MIRDGAELGLKLEWQRVTTSEETEIGNAKQLLSCDRRPLISTKSKQQK